MFMELQRLIQHVFKGTFPTELTMKLVNISAITAVNSAQQWQAEKNRRSDAVIVRHAVINGLNYLL